MSAHHNPIGSKSVLALVVLTVVLALVGFVWLPSVQSDFSARGVWDAICRAAGAPASWNSQATRATAISPPMSCLTGAWPTPPPPTSSAAAPRWP